MYALRKCGIVSFIDAHTHTHAHMGIGIFLKNNTSLPSIISLL